AVKAQLAVLGEVAGEVEADVAVVEQRSQGFGRDDVVERGREPEGGGDYQAGPLQDERDEAVLCQAFQRHAKVGCQREASLPFSQYTLLTRGIPAKIVARG